MFNYIPALSAARLSVSNAPVLHLSFWPGPGISHEMASELVYGANVRCVLHHFSSLARSKGSWGQLWRPKTGPKQHKTKTKMIMFPKGLIATK